MTDSKTRFEIIHFADPWCWWSWGLEPVLQRLRAVYGDQMSIAYRMGGVFDDIREWQREYDVDDAGTRSWTRESMEASGNPVNPGYMIDSKVKSTYRSCRAFKAAQLQNSPHKSELFFRRMMELFQVEASYPTDEVLLDAAAHVGLDRDQMAKGLDSTEVDEAFRADKREMRVNFLSLLVVLGEESYHVQGSFHAAPIEKLIDAKVPGIEKHEPDNLLNFLAGLPGHLVTTREVAETFQIPDGDADKRMQALEAAGLVDGKTRDYGTFWVPRVDLPIDDPRGRR